MLKILLVLLPIHAFATVGLGTFVPYAFKAQTDDSGSTSKFELNPYISVNHLMAVSGPHYFNPELGFVYHQGVHEEYSKQTIFINYHFSYRYNNLFLLYGLTNFITRISGNKTGSYTDESGGVNSPPSQTSMSYTTALNLGAELFVQSNLSIKLNTSVMGFLDSKKRKVNYLLGISYYR